MIYFRWVDIKEDRKGLICHGFSRYLIQEKGSVEIFYGQIDLSTYRALVVISH